MSEFVRQMKSYATRNIGFACFLAWNYIALFGCAMAAGVFVPYNLEFIWIVSAASQLACALVGLVVSRTCRIAQSRAWGAVAAACAVVGNCFLWASYIYTATFWTTFVLAGLFMGVGIAIMTAVWGSRLSSGDHSKIEFDIMTSFVIAFALYCITLPIKLYGTVDLAVNSLLPVLSMHLAFRRPRQVGAGSASGGEVAGTAAGQELSKECPQCRYESNCQGVSCSYTAVRAEMKESLSTFTMVAALWFLVAFMRVLSNPTGVHDRYPHYFFPFFFGFVVTVALFAVLLKNARCLNISLAFRWELPFLLLGFALLCVDFTNMDNRVAAFSMNFVGMFGMQISCWMAATKHVGRRTRLSASVFLGFAASQGLGIFLGCGIGLLTAGLMQGTALLGIALAVMTGALFVVMLTGFNPHWRLDARGSRAFSARSVEGIDAYVGAGMESGAGASSVAGAGACDGIFDESDESSPQWDDRLERLFRDKASALQRDFGLTGRETEIVALLLAGRSRPYIRDELVISLNTVHTHASNIFSKCGVHSQQELIDLAHNGWAS